MAGDTVYGYMSPISYAMQPDERAAETARAALSARAAARHSAAGRRRLASLR
jgi:hypothetical protein